VVHSEAEEFSLHAEASARLELETLPCVEARGDVLKGFSIAGADRKFHLADARIEGNEVVVSSKEVSDPAGVRYAWANNPDCNLYNKKGLPASPFRTDDWPGASAGKR
jgi:sialate O-acetylesterase